MACRLQLLEPRIDLSGRDSLPLGNSNYRFVIRGPEVPGGPFCGPIHERCNDPLKRDGLLADGRPLPKQFPLHGGPDGLDLLIDDIEFSVDKIQKRALVGVGNTPSCAVVT